MFAVAIGDEGLVDLTQIRKLVSSGRHLLQLRNARNAEHLGDQLLDLLCAG